jgi:hypothetical protein
MAAHETDGVLLDGVSETPAKKRPDLIHGVQDRSSRPPSLLFPAPYHKRLRLTSIKTGNPPEG